MRLACQAGNAMARASKVALVKASEVSGVRGGPWYNMAYEPERKGRMRLRGCASQVSLPRSLLALRLVYGLVASESHWKMRPA